ncbi:hypothetical protein [Rubellicoccus peritrichatus]|uniref:TonB C-terminal domain-containing protein n=1 Tax=Rubellicoccus peritrichatus TaxID=3080537 RepID=A0AAQ3LBG4_9BACT|nr:hypothetical protein [Puniceicoccus sp. CR14]WOO42785.1 hypothetical protein RZN69_06750 [Puniceicoccus sp. CR14]
MSKNLQKKPVTRSGASLWPKWSESSEDSKRDLRRSVFAGLAVTIAFHLAIILSIPWDRIDVIEVKPPEPNPPMEVEFVQLPEFVQTNPESEIASPDETNNMSDRDQQAAQEIPDELSDSDRPTVEGEMDSENIVDGAPLDPTPPPLPEGQQVPDQEPVPPQPEQQPVPEVQQEQEETNVPETPEPEPQLQETAPEALEQEPVTEEGELSMEEVAEEPTPEPVEEPQEEATKPEPQPEPVNEKIMMEEIAPQQASQSGAPSPKPRPRLNFRVPSGPLMQNNRGATKVGSVAIDAKFSQFGAYIARMREAIQSTWYLLATQSKYTGADIGTNVVVEFVLDQQGNLLDVKVLHSTASSAGTIMVLESIKSRAPYGDWTQDMKQVIGDTWTVRINFFYR